MNYLVILFFVLPFLNDTTTIPEDEGFRFILEITDQNTINLQSTKGCAWSQLSFNCTMYDCEKRINEFGMVIDVDQNYENKSLANFLIDLKITDEQVFLTCEDGCNWESISFKTLKKSVVVDDEGIKFP